MVETRAEFSKVQLLEVDADQAGQRVDNFLMARLKGVPKSRIYRLLRKGEVRVNKGRVKPMTKLCAGDLVRIPPIVVADKKPEVKPGQGLVQLLERSILLETDALLVVNKPAGLAVHGGSGINLGLIESLRQMRPDARYLELVHRLDRGTSGCILVAKKRSMLRHLQAAFRDKSAGAGGPLSKTYQALVVGCWSKRKTKVAEPLLRDELKSGDRIVRVDQAGKSALTRFRVLQCYHSDDCSQDFTLVEALPVTGRTHQIRVHAQWAGHSLVGDDKYGDDQINEVMRRLGVKRLFLHASRLSFLLPGETEVTTVEAPLTEDLSMALSRLQQLSD